MWSVRSLTLLSGLGDGMLITAIWPGLYDIFCLFKLLSKSRRPKHDLTSFFHDITSSGVPNAFILLESVRSFSWGVMIYCIMGSWQRWPWAWPRSSVQQFTFLIYFEINHFPVSDSSCYFFCHGRGSPGKLGCGHVARKHQSLLHSM